MTARDAIAMSRDATLDAILATISVPTWYATDAVVWTEAMTSTATSGVARHATLDATLDATRES